jgi:2-oxoglutarate ferredoxin oxidoreductase subunit delta
MAKVQGEIIVDIEKCKGCELCIVACPEETLGLATVINNKGYRYAIRILDNCTGCANCALVCPDAVITVFRKVEKKTAN